MRVRRVLVSFAHLCLIASSVAAAPRRDVLVVVNRQAPDGQAVADAYRAVRDIPESHQLLIDVAAQETIRRDQYLTAVERPIADWLQRQAAQDEITHIVLVRGVPLRVQPDAGTRMPLAAVDSSLALLYRKLTGAGVGAGPVPNPLFLEQVPAAGWPGFDRSRHDIYLVTRLDGFTAADATALAKRCGPSPATTPRVVLDGRPAATGPEHQWFTLAAERLRGAVPNVQVDLDQTASAVRDVDGVVGYFSWGAADPVNRERTLPVAFAPGAVGASLSSSDVRTFKEPPTGWKPGSWRDRRQFFEGTAEWLAGDLVRAGITGWAGAVADPYVDGVVRPQVLLPAYLAGRSLGESYYLATKYLGWRTVVLGDPLCRPFGQETEAPPLTRDERSGLTRPFLDRVMEQARRTAPPGTAGSLEVRVAARARLAQGDRARALTLLREWGAAHPEDLLTQQMLSLTLDPSTEREEAIAAYRAVLAQRPNDPVVANNLAFALATSPEHRAEALDLARRAYEQTRGEPTIADTYGWVLYHAGDLEQAERVLLEAVRRDPSLADARLHLALVHLGRGDLQRAREQWQGALERDASIAGRPEAAALVKSFGTSVPR
jgi:uncharacterized protein (TIGR03790 family)